MKFKNQILIIGSLLNLLFSQCAAPHYNCDYQTPKVLDFRKGKWLINVIETDLNTYKARELLNKNFVSKFKKIGGNYIYFIDDIRMKYSLPNEMPFSTPPENIELLKLTTEFNYLVNIKTSKIKNDLHDIYLTAPLSYGKSEAETEIVIYEIKTGEIIFSQRTVGSVTLNENDRNIRFAKSAEGLTFSTINKALREIKKNAIK
ncbi:MAG: hypothetical protein JXR51_13405 [Bacteroidales bacterium]|nr:hypothetical protein [Bacteroidales bacterium]MBN2758163.1 hypothetical protein [Bacteroidales bacterium]